jgi:hypothetical protein
MLILITHEDDIALLSCGGVAIPMGDHKWLINDREELKITVDVLVKDGRALYIL